ncbi:hypothetical protein FI667_g8850, partial [Globisporangium splendens]
MTAKDKRARSDRFPCRLNYSSFCVCLLVASGEFVGLEHCISVVANEDPRESSEPTADNLARKPRRDEKLRHPKIQDHKCQRSLHHGRVRIKNHWKQHDHRHVAVDAREAIRVWISVRALVQGAVEINGTFDLRQILQQQHAQQIAHADGSPKSRITRMKTSLFAAKEPRQRELICIDGSSSAPYKQRGTRTDQSISDMSCVR